jgi:type II secretory pathway component PulF
MLKYLYNKPLPIPPSSLFGASARFQAMDFLITFLQASIFLTAAFQFHVWSNCMTFLQKTSCRLPLGSPTGLLLTKIPPI